LSAAIDPDRCELVGESVYVDGFNCLHLRENADNDIVRNYWIDSERDFVIIRQIERHEGKPAAQLDITYEKNKQHGWTTAGWTVMLMQGSEVVEDYPGRKELFQFLAATVTSATINEPVSVEMAKVVFPPGTVVNDAVGKQHYLIQSNSNLKELTRDDLFALKREGSQGFWKRRLSPRT